MATKRKFPSFRTAKRLPRRAAADWYVYAAVIQTEDEVGSFGTQVAESDSDTPGDAYVKSRENAKRGRSVRFAGIADNASSGTEQTTSGEEKETTGGSTYSLSKFKFPTPPGFVTWADTFGESIDSLPSHEMCADFRSRSPRRADTTYESSYAALQRRIL